MLKIKHIALSPSSIQLFLSCPQKFMYEKFRTRAERTIDLDKPTPSEWGTLFHSLLAQHYGHQAVVPTGCKSVDARFAEYVKHYGQEDFEITSVEETLIRPLTDVISLMGTADIVTPQGLWDHKTTSSFSDKDQAKFENSDQFCHYLHLCGRTSGDVVLNQISRSEYKTYSGAERASKLFNRLYFTIDEAQMADWLQRTTAVAHHIVRVIEDNTAWLFKRTSACGDFGGCFNATQCNLRIYEPDNLVSLTDEHFSITLEG